MNLVVNARDAASDRGRIRVRTGRVELGAGFVDRHLGASDGLHAFLEVEDDGGGIDEEILDHIFEPFFSTKGKEKGTGLGLATVYGIVTQSGGFIEVDNRPGEGVAFRTYFPAAV